MQKNWYVVYTKPHCEKKITSLLTKRKIENFCPYNRKQIRHLRKNKLVFEALFDSYVFVNISDKEVPLIEQLENVVSLVYWKCKPAIITGEEIEMIKDFTSRHSDIRLEKNNINLNGNPKNIEDGANYTIDGNILRIINRSIKVNLPSLGFTMIAELEGESGKERMIGFNNQEFLVQS